MVTMHHTLIVLSITFISLSLHHISSYNLRGSLTVAQQTSSIKLNFSPQLHF